MSLAAENGFKMLRQVLTRWIAPLALVAVMVTVAAACPTCKDGLDQNDPQHQAVAAGFYYSILFMLSMPYVILGSLGYLAYVSIRRAKAQQAPEALPRTALPGTAVAGS
jgi:hypothetical protein